MTIPADAILLSDNAISALDTLEAGESPRAAAIAKRARRYRSILLLDCLHGEVVRKSLIPHELLARYSVENLYVEDLPDYWRMLYAIVKSGGKRVVMILEIVDHKAYDRWFGGRGR